MVVPKIVRRESDAFALWFEFPTSYMVLTLRRMTKNEQARYAYGFLPGNDYVSGHCVKSGKLVINPGHPPVDPVKIKKLRKAYEIQRRSYQVRTCYNF